MTNHPLDITYKATSQFFESIGGKILSTSVANVTTFSSPDKPVFCPNYYVGFSNKNLFGNGDYHEAYSRFRKMRADWKLALQKVGINEFEEIAPGFIPLLDGNYNGECYPMNDSLPLGVQIVPAASIVSDYFNFMIKTFGVKFALMENKGMLIGPEGGMLETLNAILNTDGPRKYFVDVAAGSGELSAYFLRHSEDCHVTVNEISRHLKTHLGDYLANMKSECQELDFQPVDCREMVIPSDVDIMSVGVFYGLQPLFLQSKGDEIKYSLGSRGILMMQTSMPETLFTHLAITGTEPRLHNWSWYDETLCLSSYLSHTTTFYVHNEFITLASNSKERIEDTVRLLENKITPIEKIYS